MITACIQLDSNLKSNLLRLQFAYQRQIIYLTLSYIPCCASTAKRHLDSS